MTIWFHYWFYIDNIDSFKLYVKRNQPYGYGQPRQLTGSQSPRYRIWVITPSARCMTLNVPSPIIWFLSGAAFNCTHQPQCANGLISKSSRSCNPRGPPPLVGNQDPGFRILNLRDPWRIPNPGAHPPPNQLWLLEQ